MNIFRKEKTAVIPPDLPPRPNPHDNMSIFYDEKTDITPLDLPPRPNRHLKDDTDMFHEEKTEATPPDLPPRPNQQSTGVTNMMQKLNPFKSSSQSSVSTSKSSITAEESAERKGTDSKQDPGLFRGVIQKVNPFKSSSQGKKEDAPPSDTEAAEPRETDSKGNPGKVIGLFQKVNPFKSTTQSAPSQGDDSSSSDSQAENNNIVKRDRAETIVDGLDPSKGTSSPSTTKKRFTIKRMLPTTLFGSGSKETAVEVLNAEMAEVPTPSEGNPLENEEDEDGLVSWWKTVEGWDEWNESSNFSDDEAEEAVEAAADRVFMAARLFVRLFNQRGALLQQRILELLALADAADHFHKKTVAASMGGGVASVAGSVTTITGLVLAPFTFGTSLIVTAVGIGVATAGGITSASANITDTVHSKTDRKKVEAIIQGYQEDMKDIKECLEFLQAGMQTLEEWNFDLYMDSISKKAMNQNVKHVMKEGGRAGKALVINAESLIGTVQVLHVAGGAAKAVQVMSITTGVMSGLFLALDLFFLAKDSMELRKGAKTEFAAKIREVCKNLQDGLLELNHIKEELQKTIDGVEVDVEEDEDEDEDEDEEEEDEDEEELMSDMKKITKMKD